MPNIITICCPTFPLNAELCNTVWTRYYNMQFYDAEIFQTQILFTILFYQIFLHKTFNCLNWFHAGLLFLVNNDSIQVAEWFHTMIYIYYQLLVIITSFLQWWDCHFVQVTVMKISRLFVVLWYHRKLNGQEVECRVLLHINTNNTIYCHFTCNSL